MRPTPDSDAGARLGAVTRAIGGRGYRLASGAQVRARRAVQVRGYIPGLLSVVVPFYNVEDYLDECLVSLRFQHYRKVEIVLVDDGSPDGSAGIARAHRRRDPRIWIVRQENAGLSAARNTGVRHARGEFLTFVDSDDIVQPTAFSAPMGALRESGSDFAVTNYDRIDKSRRKPADRWIREAHAVRRLGMTVDEFPDAMVNAVAWSKTYRRVFWDQEGLSFPVGKLYEDQQVSMAAYGRARAFDVLPEIGVSWRIRNDRSSITQAQNTTNNLAGHIEAVRSSLHELNAAGKPHAAERRVLQILANNMPFFLRHIVRGDEKFWHLLGVAITDLMESLPPEVYAHEVAAHNKLLYELLMTDRREDARGFLTGFGADARRFPTTVADDGVHSALPLGDTMPRHVTVMADDQLALQARALRSSLGEDGVLTVEGWAYIRNIDLAENLSTLSVDLVGPNGERIPMAATRRPEPRTDLVGDHWYCDYRPGGFTATLDTTGLGTGNGPWVVTASLTVGAIHREAPVFDAARGGSTRVPRVLGREDGSQVWVDAVRRPLTVSVVRSPAEVVADGVDRLALASWRGHVPATSPTAGLVAPTVLVSDAWLEEEALVAVISGLPAGDEWLPVVVTGEPTAEVVLAEGSVDRSDPAAVRLTLPFHRDHWGRPRLGLPSGKFTVRLRSAGGATIALVPAPGLLDRLPVDQRVARYFASVEVAAGPQLGLAVALEAPLAEDEWGPRNQRRLREEHRVARAEDDSVFFRALYGEAANCNGLGVHEELRRRGSDLTLFWSVVDHSVPVPEGGVGVIEGSRAWHDAVARSRYHMVNVHQLDWFAKPEGQAIIQTMHGYPYKVMGHEWWEKGGFPSPQVANYDRRAREWDHFVSPATYATPLLVEAFLRPAGSRAEVLEIGYPRNDVLFSPDAASIRQRTRAHLGARAGQTVVMYAPTFRDYLSSDDKTARRVDFFDAEAAGERLGDEYLLLVRGHAFNARASDRAPSRANVVDVTDHPDVNELILASDVAVLDYSSLRFDYALTGKPMIFLVPDLRAYDRARGGVIPYRPTAPGPLVTSTREVVRQLRDLDGLRRSTAPRIAEFRRTFADLDDGNAAARLVDAVFVPRGDALPATDAWATGGRPESH